jgi:hypothetical protein
MHRHHRRDKASGCDSFFNPEHYVIASAMLIIAKVVIETKVCHCARL